MNFKRISKNPTPHQLALLAAGILALVGGILLLMAYALGILTAPWYFFIIFPCLIFLAVLYTTRIILDKYIYRKIKVIYKSIRKEKLKPTEKKEAINLKENILDDVEKEVTQWRDSHEREVRELKQLEEYRRNFMGDISHELKTPIFNIQGYLHTLLDGGLHDEKINQKYLGRAAKNVERLHNIVQDLESISRLEEGEFYLDVDSFDIKKLTLEVFDEMDILALNKKITLRFKEGGDHPYKVLADRETIRQVLVNLISNSIKYGKEGGRTHISFYDMDKHILVEVADNGIGIGKNALKHVFDRFYRVDKSRSRDEGGTGLGLSIVKHIMEAHRQSVNVRSSVGLGTTFGFTLEKSKEKPSKSG